MKKFKIVISIILVMMLAITSSVTAFATDVDLENEKQAIIKKANYAELLYIYDLYITPVTIPSWSPATSDNLINVVDRINKEVPMCETLEEVKSYQVLLDEAIDNLSVSSWNLQWMINYMEKDYKNETNCYDEETYAELKTIYENAQKALDSGVDKDIHNAYVEMRNELNKLCEYNSVYLDVDNDGVFSIKDCTLMQMQIAGLVELTSSQRYIAIMYKDTSIADVTRALMTLAKFPDYQYDPKVTRDFVEIDPKEKNYLENPEYEESNAMYYFDRYNLWY